eukprot:scaffold55868_cov58-Phaeocystis_antarctica.AAC.2
MTKTGPIRSRKTSAAQAADWPGLADAPGSPRRDLALKEASGEPAGRGPSQLGFDMGAYWQVPGPVEQAPASGSQSGPGHLMFAAATSTPPYVLAQPAVDERVRVGAQVRVGALGHRGDSGLHPRERAGRQQAVGGDRRVQVRVERVDPRAVEQAHVRVRHPVDGARAALALDVHQLAALVLRLGELARIVALRVVHALGVPDGVARLLLEVLRRALVLAKQP